MTPPQLLTKKVPRKSKSENDFEKRQAAVNKMASRTKVKKQESVKVTGK